jgi:hypothetical protein
LGWLPALEVFKAIIIIFIGNYITRRDNMKKFMVVMLSMLSMCSICYGGKGQEEEKKMDNMVEEAHAAPIIELNPLIEPNPLQNIIDGMQHEIQVLENAMNEWDFHHIGILVEQAVDNANNLCH